MDAWQRIQSTPFDCVVADIRMPRMGGQELYELAEATDPDLAGRFIFVTGDTMSRGTSEFLATKRNRSLTKPVDANELLDLVATITVAQRPRSQVRAPSTDDDGPTNEMPERVVAMRAIPGRRLTPIWPLLKIRFGLVGPRRGPASASGGRLSTQQRQEVRDGGCA